MPVRKALRKKSGTGTPRKAGATILRLGDLDTQIRGMNVAASAARAYLKEAGKSRVGPAHIARLIDANLSLMGQRVMTRVRKFERTGRPDEAERTFQNDVDGPSLVF